jgi:hypothetical protein
VKQVIVDSFAADFGSKKTQPGWHKRSSPLHRRVQAIGTNVLEAARAEIGQQLAALPPQPAKKEDRDKLVERKREDLIEADSRLRGTWHWVVTNSDAINVRARCPPKSV